MLLPQVLFSRHGNAQIDQDTLMLPEFELRSSFVPDYGGFKRVRIDSTLLAPRIDADLSTVISQYSTIFIKNYGNGTLATPSFRGTSAQHTQVEWNGISLNSPMLGQMDFSQIPVAQFDGVEILYGSAGISRTGGAFGGVIDLVTHPGWSGNDQIMIYQKAGSFGTFGTNVNISTGNRILQTNLKFNCNTAVNDFPFTMGNGMKVTQKNSAYAQAGISQEFFWRIKDRHLLSAKTWYALDDRNLPPTENTYDSAKTERLTDKAFRTVLEYKLADKGWSLQARSAVNYQFMIYDNTLPVINSAHQSVSWINRIRLNYNKIKKLSIRPGIDFTHDRVRSDDYENELTTRNATGLFTELTWEIAAGIKSTLVLREDIVDGRLGKLIPALAMEFRPWKSENAGFSVNVSRNYRYPTLNDLYWKDFGSPDLKPETSYALEGGCVYNTGTRLKKWFLETSLTGYVYQIFDMITWIPTEESGGLSKPENVDEILSRGIEAGLNIEGAPWNFKIDWKNNYMFCRSTYEKVSSPDDKKLGKQQIYTPVHNFNSTLSAERWNFYVRYTLTYVSDRFTGKDNAEYMPGFSLSNIIFGRNLKLRQIILSLQLDINNLFDLDYQSIDSRPMPGINYAISLKINFSGAKGS